ncbi:MAG: hypothetical protein AVDCRST_MAG53-477 [uncultured Solirubrobacteraceae bacterium]|uniref:Uncharacterized protein n=1 Tax=uncultured Solirubrobacteraceae bacterium TaxID=1162706 RepID=A0A6J4RQ14_9ACTN|nr:MAG: hypothetical protein AVDCRST_MAG53-477 [uncultured Solirubrobacteraceae bacterium]
MSSRRLREALGADDAVIALRYLGVVFVGVSLAFGVGGAEEIVLLIRIVGCLGATGLVLLVLLARAEEGGSEHRPLLALAIVAPALTLVLLLLGAGEDSAFAPFWWSLVVLFMPLTLASMLMAMPLLDVRPETQPPGRVRRVWAGGSGVQPLPDLVATAVVSLIAIVSTSLRRSTESTRGRGPASPEPPGADATRRHGR